MTPNGRIRALTLLGLLVLPLFISGQTIPTNAAPTGPRTSLIVGQVVDATTGAAIPDAIVLINLPKYSPTLSTTPYGRVMADGEGRFFFSDLPAGDYYLNASHPGYAEGRYGEQKPFGQYQLLTLGQGEQRTDVTLRVWKYAVIAGTVLDEAGEPVVGVTVRGLGRTMQSGRVQYGTTQIRDDLVPTAITDDRGAFRLSQLLAGAYVIAVPSTQITAPVESLSGQNYGARVELDYAGVREVTAIGNPGTLQAGDVAFLTSSRALVPPAASAAGRMSVYRTTFYPNAMTVGDAMPISVKPGDERSDVAITLRPAPAVRVSGRVMTPDGSAPAPMSIYLAGESSKDVVITRPPLNASFDTAVALTDASGRFTFLGVPPGEYVLQQSSPFLSRALQTGVPTYWVSQTITVGPADIADVMVQARPPLHVAGRIEFHAAATLEKPPSSFITLETPFGEPGQVGIQILTSRGLTFETLAAGGKYFIRPNELATRGWFTESVVVNGKDYTDRVFDLREDTTSLLITFTDQRSPITGTVKDARGNAIGNAVVLAFPVDRQRWTGYGRSPRDLVSAITSATGVYTVPNLPAGEYFVVAVQAVGADDWQDPKTLELLSNRATRIKVNAGDQGRTLDLTVR